MFNTIADFLKGWKFESGATLKVFRNLTDASLAQRVTPEGRSLGFLAWHITTAVSDMLSAAGVPVRVTKEDEPVPATAAAIVAAYEKAASAAAAALPKAWTDAQLADEIPMYGMTWTKSATLQALLSHQAHHRAQMTVLMRQAGLKVPGVYGPSLEEGIAMGMPAMP